MKVKRLVSKREGEKGHSHSVIACDGTDAAPIVTRQGGRKSE